ncbi:MAG: hypothetical protein BGO69_16800 [Bacteroidetes bacterium 46-16]|nr:MAG: hypothetical protein BGO69_16800 [Bacteroidetes bacterium 46-16]
MKRTIAFIAALLFAAGLKAQSLDEGIKMYRYERYMSAERILTPLAASDAKANYYLGLAQLDHGNTAAAQATFAKYPEDVANIAGTARVAFENKNTTQAMQIAEAVAGKAKRKNWEPLFYAADAITYTEGGNYQQAIDWYKKALESIQNDPYVFISLGDAYQKIQGGGGEAMNSYEKAVSIDPKNSLAYSRIGRLWYDARNYPLALENFGKAKDADPANPLPYRDLANAYYRSGKYELAKQNIEKYRELSDPSYDVERYYLDILYQSKYFKEAIQKAAELLDSGKKDCLIYGVKGFSEQQIGDTVNALKDMKVFFNCPGKKVFPSDYITFGSAFLMNSFPDSADFYFGKAISIDTAKDKSDTYRQIAEAFKDRKEYKKSAQWYEKLVTEYPETQPVDYFWAGAMYYYSQDYTNADRLFEMMEKKYPDQPSATYWRGRVGAAQDPQGDTCKAAPFFSKWLDMVGPNYDKKNDLKLAYEYLVLCAYKSKNKDTMHKYMDLLRALEPEDSLLKQIEEAEKAEKAAGSKGKK